MKKIALFAILILCVVLQACHTQTLPTTIYKDSVRVEYKLDSVYVYQHDSVFRDRWREGDTIYVTTEKWCTRYKDKIVLQHDTISTNDSKTIVQEVKYTPKFYKVCTWLFWIIVIIIVLYIVYRIVKFIYLRK